MGKKTSLIGIVIALFIITIMNWHSVTSAEEPKPTPTPIVEVEHKEIDQLAGAVVSKIIDIQGENGRQAYPNVELENIHITADVTYATGWIIRKDPETGDYMPSEPGVFIAERAVNDWTIYLPSDYEWTDKVRSFPQELISNEEKNRILGMDVDFGVIEEIATDGGYLLPWAKGQAVNLSRSVAHDADFPSGNAHYAFDFYIPQTMFNLYAAKAGTVWAFKDTVPNNDHSDVNFIVLRNADNPNLYQLYLHLAQGSIPPSLKSIGAQVIQGQFVGIADNTGASTGHHLHFQVETLPYWPVDNPYWGKSVDITFAEVNIYGGRPRRAYEYDEEICGGYCEDGLITYVSANTLKGDLTPPIGDFEGVTMGQIVETPTLILNGWGADGQSGLYSGQLRALYDGAWHNLGGTFNNNFSYTWDLCASDNPVPKGVVSMGLRLYDWDGNWADYAGLRHFVKDFDCPQAPPACSPAANQVTLYEDIDFGGGCVIFGQGNYPDTQSLGALGENDAASIRIGSSAQATLYSEEGYGGHSETIIANDNNFIDNLIGLDTLSSLKVSDKTGTSGIPIVLGPSSGASFSEDDLIPLSWKNGDNSVEYQLRYTLNGETTITLDWQSSPFSFLGSLAPGDYTWQVRGRNQNNIEGGWSELVVFEITPASPLPSSFNAPYTDDMETSEDDWASSGMWDLKNDAEKSYSGTHSWWYEEADGDYDNGVPNYGNLTSPPIHLPFSGYYLSFWYRYETETKGLHWDQRWLQISVNGNAFTNFYQLQDDPQIYETSSWLQSKVFDLSEFADDTLRFRFVREISCFIL